MTAQEYKPSHSTRRLFAAHSAPREVVNAAELAHAETSRLPDLPVLRDLVELVQGMEGHEFSFRNTAFVCIQHVMPQMIEIIRTLIALGANPSNIFVLGKIYSTDYKNEIPKQLAQLGVHVIVPDDLTSYVDGEEIPGITTDRIKCGGRPGLLISDEKRYLETPSYAEVFDEEVDLLWKWAERVLVQKIDEESIDEVLILDDGGKCIKYAVQKLMETRRDRKKQEPSAKSGDLNVTEDFWEALLIKRCRMAAVEQTSAGMDQIISYLSGESHEDRKFNALSFPIVQLASCALKYRLERQLIAQHFMDKFREKFSREIEEARSSHIPLRIGIIGLGYVGMAVLDLFLEDMQDALKNFPVQFSLCDKNDEVRNESAAVCKEKKVACCPFKDPLQLVEQAQYVLGFTGAGPFQEFTDEQFNELLVVSEEPKFFLSCSSENVEFLPLIEYIRRQPDVVVSCSPKDDIEYKNIKIVYGGYPFNFSGDVPGIQIRRFQIILGALCGSLVQAHMGAFEQAQKMRWPESIRRNTTFESEFHCFHQVDPKLQQWLLACELRQEGSFLRGIYPAEVLEVFNHPTDVAEGRTVVSCSKYNKNSFPAFYLLVIHQYGLDFLSLNEKFPSLYRPVLLLWKALDGQAKIIPKDFTQYARPEFLRLKDNSIRFGVTPALNPKAYVEREAPQEKLETFFDAERGDDRALANYCGESGSGKTLLALRYYYYSSRHYERRFWFNATSSDTLKSGYMELGEREHLFLEDMDEREKREVVISWLEKQPNILLIYDNAPSMQVLTPYLPKKRAHMLVTSLESMGRDQIPVGDLTGAEAVQLIKRVAQAMGDDEMIFNLSEILELTQSISKSPIALEQMLIYIAEMRTSVESYIDAYKACRVEHRDASSAEICIRLNLETFNADTLNTLLCFAVLGLKNIPVGLFPEEAILEHLRKCFILDSDDRCTEIFIHSIFQQVLQEMIRESDSVVEVVNHVLRRVYDYVTNNMVEKKTLWLHIKSILRYIEVNNIEASVDQNLLAHLYCQLSLIQSSHARSKGAQESLDKASRLYSESQQPPGTRDVLFEYRRLFSRDHIYWEGGSQLTEQIGVMQDARQLCIDYPELGTARLAKAMHNLGVTYSKLGDRDSAEKIFRDILNQLKDLKQDRNIAKQLAYAHVLLGFVLCAKQQYKEAIQHVNQVIACLNRVGIDFQNDSVYLGLANECLGSAYLGKGDKARARDYLHFSLTARVREHGKDYRLVAQTKQNIALAQEDIGKAIKYFSSALEILFKNYKSNDKHGVAECYHAVGRSMLSFERKEIAKVFLLETLRSMKGYLPEHYYHSHYKVRAITDLLFTHYGIGFSKVDEELSRHIRAFPKVVSARENLKALLLTAKEPQQRNYPRIGFFAAGLGIGAASTALAIKYHKPLVSYGSTFLRKIRHPSARFLAGVGIAMIGVGGVAVTAYRSFRSSR